MYLIEKPNHHLILLVDWFIQPANLDHFVLSLEEMHIQKQYLQYGGIDHFQKNVQNSYLSLEAQVCSHNYLYIPEPGKPI